MVLVSQRKLFIFLAAAILFLLASTALGYHYLYRVQENAADEAAPEDTLAEAAAPEDAIACKLAAERLLYIGITGTLILLILFAGIYRKRVRIEQKLRRLATLGGTASPGRQLSSESLGSLGDTLSVLYRRILEINEQQAFKLSGQAELISLLTADAEAPIAVTDVTGKLLYTSARYDKRAGEIKSKLIGNPIESVEESVVISEIMNELENSHTFRAERGYTVIPVINSRGSISYLLFDFRPNSPFAGMNSMLKKRREGKSK